MYIQEDCRRHSRPAANKWFDHEDEDLSRDAVYWGRDKEREVRTLERMLVEYLPGGGSPEPEVDRRFSQRELARTFAELADRWRAETAHLSSLTQKITHPAYLRIISLGPAVLPLVLERLETQPAYWFVALRALSDCDPVKPDDHKSFRASRQSWLNWGRSRGLI